MVGRNALFALVALGSVCATTTASAQVEDTAQALRLPTLSERLEQFRKDLLVGTDPDQRRGGNPNQSPDAKGKATSPQRRARRASRLSPRHAWRRRRSRKQLPTPRHRR